MWDNATSGRPTELRRGNKRKCKIEELDIPRVYHETPSFVTFLSECLIWPPEEWRQKSQGNKMYECVAPTAMG